MTGHRLSGEERRIAVVLLATFGEESTAAPRDFITQPKPYSDLEQVASGIPTEPSAIYKKRETLGYLQVWAILAFVYGVRRGGVLITTIGKC